MTWLKSIGSVFNGAKKDAKEQPELASLMAANMSPLDKALHNLPAGSALKPSQWVKVRALHKKSDELEQSGDLMAARERSVQALHLAEKLGGNQDPALAACLFHFACGLENSGDLISAEPNLNGACSILQPTEGEATLLKAELLLASGSLFLGMGIGWRAATWFGLAKSRFDELFGEQDENVGRALMGLGSSYEIEGLEDEAIDSYDQAIRILKVQWEPRSPSLEYLIWTRANLAFWRAAKAEDHQGVEQELLKIRSSLEQLEDEIGSNHPTVVDRRAILGAMLMNLEQFEEGINLLAGAVNQLEVMGQAVSPGYRRILARFYVTTGRTAEAVVMHRKAFQEDLPLGTFLAHGSERERLGALEKANEELEQFLDAMLFAGNQSDPHTVTEACDLVLGRKALGAEILLLQRQAVANNDNPELKPLMDQLAELRAHQAASSLAGEEYDVHVAAQIERTEWEIASNVVEIDTLTNTPITHEFAAEQLPAASALIEFVRFTRYSMVKTGEPGEESYHPSWYLAFIVRSDATNGVQLVDLGPADDLDVAIERYRSALSQPGFRADVRAGHSSARELLMTVDDDETPADEGASLPNRLLGALRSAIEGCSRLFIAADGHLAWLPFEALCDDSGAYLIESMDISYLNTGRDLRHLHANRFSDAFSSPVVMADPDYDSAHRENSQSNQASSGLSVTQPDLSMPETRFHVREVLRESQLRFERLPGTRKEGIAVAALLGVEPLLGTHANETQLKAIQSPLILHVATHGFYLPAPDNNPESERSGQHDLISAAMHDPLVRSGLALSGANTGHDQDLASAYLDDGILTGEDVVGIELTATEMVVLSACQTGLGDLLAGEGVSGLRRAFMVAGARTLIVSLWSVPDEQTQMLISYFYKRLLQGQGRAASLKAAQLQLRKQFPDPYYWAAFICIGDPGPIKSMTPRAERAN